MKLIEMKITNTQFKQLKLWRVSAILHVLCFDFGRLQDTYAHFSMMECPSPQRSIT